MNQHLDYGKIYRLILSDEGYNGMYLGEKVSKKRLKTNHIILVDNSDFINQYKKKLDRNFLLIKFEKYWFDTNNKLILENMDYIKNLSKGEISYLEELVKKIPKQNNN
ncbi:hypothetical protein KBC25_02975 [Candidatus Pacearchaeota archaeon]|jgi:hypothetical protein|nr:hypothetical protein [Candidatus Pacearchaeota archaeon]